MRAGMFDFVCEKGARERGPRNNGANRHARGGRQRCDDARRRDAPQTDRRREITSHARNDHETVTPIAPFSIPVFPLVAPSLALSFSLRPSSSPRGIRIPMSSFLSTYGRRSTTCPRRILPQRSAVRRLVFTLPGERRERQVGTEATYRLSHFCDTAREHTRCPETTERLLLVWRANGIKTARDIKENNTCNVGKSCFHPAHALP